MYGDAELTKLSGVGKCEVIQDPPRRENILKNGTFKDFTWDSSDYYYWTQSGTPAIDNDNDMLKMGSNVSVGDALPTEYIYTTVNLHNPTSITIDFDWTPTYAGTPSHKSLIIGIYDGANYCYGSLKSGTLAWAGSGVISVEAGTTAELEHITIELPGTVTGGGFARGMALTIRIYEFYNENAAATNYFHLTNMRLTVESAAPYTKTYSYDNTTTIYQTKEVNLALGDSWRKDYFPASSADDEFWITKYTGSFLTTNEWFIYGHNPTTTTPVKIAELLATQMVEGYPRSIDAIRGTIRTTYTDMSYTALRDSDFVDSYGWTKVFWPVDMDWDCRKKEWYGQWIELPATYTDSTLEWDDHDFGVDGSIDGNEFSVDAFTITAGLEEARFEVTHAAVVGELLRLVIVLTDTSGSSSSDLPTMTLDGDALTVAWGTNYITYVCDDTGTQDLVLTGEEDDYLYLSCTVDLYYITGI